MKHPLPHMLVLVRFGLCGLLFTTLCSCVTSETRGPSGTDYVKVPAATSRETDIDTAVAPERHRRSVTTRSRPVAAADASPDIRSNHHRATPTPPPPGAAPEVQPGHARNSRSEINDPSDLKIDDATRQKMNPGKRPKNSGSEIGDASDVQIDDATRRKMNGEGGSGAAENAKKPNRKKAESEIPNPSDVK